MSIIWYANASAHCHQTKIGRKPTHPTGQRRIDNNLAIFLTQHLSVSFEENDHLCSPCYLTAQRELSRIKSNNSPVPMDTEQFRPKRVAATAALSSISTNINIESCISEPSNSSEETSDEEMTNFLPRLQREKSTALLNGVFRLVGQSPIVDIRNRNILRRKVDDALADIRKAAEQILQEQEKEEEVTHIDNFLDITLSEAGELTTNFKYLVGSSEYSEQIRLLTLAPKDWGRLKIENFFSCSQHQARYSVYLRDADRILTLPVDCRGNLAFDPVIKKEIFDFYYTDEVTRVRYLQRGS